MAKSAKRKTDNTVATAHDRVTTGIEAAANIGDNDIARRAYDLYLARGREPGHELEDWLRAEHELRESSSASIA